MIAKKLELARTNHLCAVGYRGPRVYFIGAPQAGRIKIGVSEDVRKRMHILRTSSPVPILLLCLIEGQREKEREMHERFAWSRAYREWFFANEIVESFVAELWGVRRPVHGLLRKMQGEP